jgi:PAS domain-containing protein
MLSTFAIYYAEPRSPCESDLQLIEGAGHVAVIAIEGERARTALATAAEQIKKSEAELRTIIYAIPQFIGVMEPTVKQLYANQAVMDYMGLTHAQRFFRTRNCRLRDQGVVRAAVGRGGNPRTSVTNCISHPARRC